METKPCSIILIGSTQAGKTFIRHRIMGVDSLPERQVGCIFESIKIPYKDITIRFQIWDTLGQGRYRSYLVNYFPLQNAILIIYNTEIVYTFGDVGAFNELVMKSCKNSIPKILIANIIHTEYRKISREEGEAKAKEINAIYMETNCTTGEGIDKILPQCCDLLYDELIKAPSLSSINSKDVKNKRVKMKKKFVLFNKKFPIVFIRFYGKQFTKQTHGIEYFPDYC